ncbi:MAG: hypothetical protein SGJ07_10065 [Rhodospirillaceae bacterium]|nr:hypothetical protein [Rhodospirillaceae bacterium]
MLLLEDVDRETGFDGRKAQDEEPLAVMDADFAERAAIPALMQDAGNRRDEPGAERMQPSIDSVEAVLKIPFEVVALADDGAGSLARSRPQSVRREIFSGCTPLFLAALSAPIMGDSPIRSLLRNHRRPRQRSVAGASPWPCLGV